MGKFADRTAHPAASSRGRIGVHWFLQEPRMDDRQPIRTMVVRARISTTTVVAIMPILVLTDELQPGMSLVEPIISGGLVMLQSGKPLTSTDISSMQRRYPGLNVRVSDPVLDTVIEFEDDAREREVAETAKNRISESMSKVGDRFARRASPNDADFGAIRNAVDEIMRYLSENPTSAALVTRCLDTKSYLCEHTGNVFYLSMLLGSTVLDYVVQERKRQTSARDLRSNFAMDLTPLGLGAMAMDLAMLPLQKLFETDMPLTEADRQAVLGHPGVGATCFRRTSPHLRR